MISTSAIENASTVRTLFDFFFVFPPWSFFIRFPQYIQLCSPCFSHYISYLSFSHLVQPSFSFCFFPSLLFFFIQRHVKAEMKSCPPCSPEMAWPLSCGAWFSGQASWVDWQQEPGTVLLCFAAHKGFKSTSNQSLAPTRKRTQIVGSRKIDYFEDKFWYTHVKRGLLNSLMT